MKHRYNRCVLPIIICILFALSSCKKESWLSQGGQIAFSVDTLTLDTVFTSRGSVTREMLIYNKQNQNIRISSVRLKRGAQSPFTINVDGKEGPEARNIEIAPNDSAYVFATVTIDPNDDDNPFIITDEIIATLNDKEFKLPIIAFGQNAIYITDSMLSTQTWKKGKPYVIFNNAMVDSGHTLTIEPGVRIYSHAQSRLFVAGTLKALGTKTDSIVFQGDRLDRSYFDGGVPGEWGGLYFTQSSNNNVLKNVHIKFGGNSTRLGSSMVQPAAIQVDRPLVTSLTPQVMLDKVTITVSLGYGVLSFGGHIHARNSLFAAAGAQCFAALEGGTYKLENCTFGGYSYKSYLVHKDNPALALLNYRDVSQTEYVAGPLNAEIINCIAYGTLENEVYLLRRDGAAYNVSVKNSLLKAKQSDFEPSTVLQNVKMNEDPLFENTENLNLRLTSESPARGHGMPLAGFNDDLDDKPRSGSWDIGCFQY